MPDSVQTRIYLTLKTVKLKSRGSRR